MARIPDDELERLKRETDLVALVTSGRPWTDSLDGANHEP